MVRQQQLGDFTAWQGVEMYWRLLAYFYWRGCCTAKAGMVGLFILAREMICTGKAGISGQFILV